MRVLLVPEVYRPDDLSANGTVADVSTWVDEWLERDRAMHVYWLLPPRETADYEAADVRADRERVTLLEAEPYASGLEPTEPFTEGGYSEAELRAIEAEIFDPGAYLDVVVDGRRAGRRTLVKWLLEHVEQWSSRVRPFDTVVNVHDLQIPRKYRYCSYRNGYQGRMELCEIALADGTWFTAPVDARAFREHAAEFLRQDAIEDALDRSRVIGSPLEFDRFDESYADRPRWLHVAGSLWKKKRADSVLGIAETLFERYGIRTVMTSVEDVPPDYASREWVDAHERADRRTYERALKRGDLAICASEYETLARTWFEQAASGQVLLLREEPWVYDCVPDDHPLVAPLEDLEALAIRSIERWSDAVAANRTLVDHLREVRSPDRVGKRTYADLRQRVESKTDRYRRSRDDDATAERGGIVSTAAAALERTDDESISVDGLLDRISGLESGNRCDSNGEIASTDAIYALRALGWRDSGDPGTATFERVR